MNLLLQTTGVLCLLAPLAAQDRSRAALLEAERQSKARHLKTVQESNFTNALHNIRVEKIFEAFSSGADGFAVRAGGLAPGSGFSIGPQYHHGFLNDNAIFRTSARGS